METTKTQTTNGKLTTTLEALSVESKLAVLNQKRTLYLQSQYDAGLEYKIADRLNDEQAKKAQMERIKRIDQAIELIEEEITAVDS